jgi:guanylate kinase
MEHDTPILVTLTAPTCAGKSYLFNYIRDVAKMPCLISTTTRPARQGEKEGIDYYFIDEATSIDLENKNQLAELAIYRGVRYGVTKEEFSSKLAQGVAFLIVEPSGLDHYVKPALDIGAAHLKYYIHADLDLRLSRFKERALADIKSAINADENLRRMGKSAGQVEKTVMSYMDRLVAITTVEQQWGTMAHWDRILFGTDDPAENLAIIMKDVAAKRQYLREYRADCERLGLPV